MDTIQELGRIGRDTVVFDLRVNDSKKISKAIVRSVEPITDFNRIPLYLLDKGTLIYVSSNDIEIEMDDQLVPQYCRLALGYSFAATKAQKEFYKMIKKPFKYRKINKDQEKKLSLYNYYIYMIALQKYLSYEYSYDMVTYILMYGQKMVIPDAIMSTGMSAKEFMQDYFEPCLENYQRLAEYPLLGEKDEVTKDSAVGILINEMARVLSYYHEDFEKLAAITSVDSIISLGPEKVVNGYILGYQSLDKVPDSSNLL